MITRITWSINGLAVLILAIPHKSKLSDHSAQIDEMNKRFGQLIAEATKLNGGEVRAAVILGDCNFL